MKALVAALLLLVGIAVCVTATPKHKCPNCDPCICGIADCECEIE